MELQWLLHVIKDGEDSVLPLHRCVLLLPKCRHDLYTKAVHRNRIRLRPYSIQLPYGGYLSRTRPILLYLPSSMVRYGWVYSRLTDTYSRYRHVNNINLPKGLELQ